MLPAILLSDTGSVTAAVTLYIRLSKNILHSGNITSKSKINTPAIDRLKMSTVTKTLGMIPGMGNITGAVSELMLGAGMVIKNSVGTAGVLILLLLVMFPLCKMFLLSLMYKVTAAVTEPAK